MVRSEANLAIAREVDGRFSRRYVQRVNCFQRLYSARRRDRWATDLPVMFGI